jgi:hypothetical protein
MPETEKRHCRRIAMAVDPRKRQKKLERRKAKQKAERRELARRESRGIASRLEAASAAPILHCCMADTIWSTGIGNVLISRKLNDGRVAFAVFLVDVYCLGVKDVFMNILPQARYDRQLYGKMASQFTLQTMKPECARKLVEGAVRYASDLGFPPHADYGSAKPIFGDIRAEDCTHEFVFGKDGQPLFCSGPNDSRARCDQILHMLHNHCGPNGFHYIIGGPLSGGPMAMAGIDDEESELDEPDNDIAIPFEP